MRYFIFLMIGLALAGILFFILNPNISSDISNKKPANTIDSNVLSPSENDINTDNSLQKKPVTEPTESVDRTLSISTNQPTSTNQSASTASMANTTSTANTSSSTDLIDSEANAVNDPTPQSNTSAAAPATPADDLQPANQPVTTIIDLTVINGRISKGNSLVRLPLDSEVTINITADANDELHLHGYDVLIPLTADKTASATFTADKLGYFEYELHHKHQTIGAIEVVTKTTEPAQD